MSRLNRTIAFSPEDHAMLIEAFGNITEGVRQCIELYRRNDTLQNALEIELQEIFSNQEINLLNDVLNNVIVQGTLRMNPKGLHIAVSDHCEQNQSDERWGVNKAYILDKIENLTPAQTAAIYSMTEKMWRKW